MFGYFSDSKERGRDKRAVRERLAEREDPKVIVVLKGDLDAKSEKKNKNSALPPIQGDDAETRSHKSPIRRREKRRESEDRRRESAEKRPAHAQAPKPATEDVPKAKKEDAKTVEAVVPPPPAAEAQEQPAAPAEPETEPRKSPEPPPAAEAQDEKPAEVRAAVNRQDSSTAAVKKQASSAEKKEVSSVKKSEEKPVAVKSPVPSAPKTPAPKTPAPAPASKPADDAQADKKKRSKSRIIRKSKLERQISNVNYVMEKYEPGKVLGDGNFAIVKSCKMKNTAHEFAMKIVDKSKLRGKEHMIENEIAIMKQCSHPNIVKLMEEYETKAEIYLIMELVKVRLSSHLGPNHLFLLQIILVIAYVSGKVNGLKLIKEHREHLQYKYNV